MAAQGQILAGYQRFLFRRYRLSSSGVALQAAQPAGVKQHTTPCVLLKAFIHLLGIEQGIQIMHLRIRHLVAPKPIRMLQHLVGTILLEEIHTLVDELLVVLKPGFFRNSDLIESAAAQMLIGFQVTLVELLLFFRMTGVNVGPPVSGHRSAS